MTVPVRRASAVSALRPCLLSAALILASLPPARSAPTDATAAERLTIVLLTLDMAQAACGLRVVPARLTALLASADLTREHLYARPITPALQQVIDDLQSRFSRHAAATCAETWRRFGPSSEAGLLTR